MEQSNESLRSELGYLKYAIEILNCHYFEAFKILSSFIKRTANVTYGIAMGAANALFTLLIVYESALESFLNGNSKVFVDDRFIIKSKKDFEMEVDNNTLQKYLETLNNLGLIEYKPQASSALFKPIVSTIVESFESHEEVFYKEREERVRKKREDSTPIKKRYQTFNKVQDEVMNLIGSTEEEIVKGVSEIAKNYNHKEDEIYLLYFLNLTYGKLTLADFNTIKKQVRGDEKDFYFSKEKKERILNTKEKLNEMKWTKKKPLGVRIAMAYKGGYDDFKKEKVEKIETQEESKISDEERAKHKRMLANFGK
jgi:hypothetical protein